MRSVVPGLAGLLAVVLLPLALLSVWAVDDVGDTTTYTSTVSPLASDPAVQGAVTTELTREVLSASGVGPGSAVGALVRRVVAAAVRSDAFPPVWTSANRSAHAQVLRLLRGGGADGQGRVSLRLGPLRLPGVQVALPQPTIALPLVDRADLVRAQRGYQLLDSAHDLLPVACAVLALVALVTARRRRAALARLALGAVVALLALLAALLVVRGYVGHDLGSADRGLVVAVWDAVSHPLRLQALAGAAGAGVLAVLAGLAARVGR